MSLDTQVYIEDVRPGDTIPPIVKNCSSRQLVMWAAASGDFYEIHYDLDAAFDRPALVVHGAQARSWATSCTTGSPPPGASCGSDARIEGWTTRGRTSRCRGRVTGVLGWTESRVEFGHLDGRPCRGDDRRGNGGGGAPGSGGMSSW